MGDHNSFGNSCGSTCVHDHCNIRGHRPGWLLVSCKLLKNRMCDVWRASQAGRSDTLTHFSSAAIHHHGSHAITFCFCLKKIVVKLKCLHKELELCTSWAILWLIVLIHHNSFPIIFPLLLQWRVKTGRALSCPKHHWASLPWEGSLPCSHPLCLMCSLAGSSTLPPLPHLQQSTAEPTWAPTSMHI